MMILKEWLDSAQCATNTLKEIKKSNCILTQFQCFHGTKLELVANQDYLLVVDYFSKYPEVIPVQSKSAYSTIKEMKAIFARHGIPNTVIADNMPFHSKEFYQFSKEWNFTLITSSLRYQWHG